jgi:hypothetical protein
LVPVILWSDVGTGYVDVLQRVNSLFTGMLTPPSFGGRLIDKLAAAEARQGYLRQLEGFILKIGRHIGALDS